MTVAKTATTDLNRVDAFVRVVETGSFTAAAAALGLPKSSVSRAVSRLEADMGVRLLQRTTRQLRLTDAGQAYFQRVQGAVSGLQEAWELATGLSREPRGTVRLTAPVDAQLIGLAEILARFRARQPAIQFELVITGRRVDLVDEGIDLAIRAGHIGDSSLVARRVAGAELGLFASAAYLKRRGTPTTAADVARHDGVVYRTRTGVQPWRLDGPRRPLALHPIPAVVSDDMSFMVAAVRAGAGLGLLPFEAGARDLVRLFPKHAVRGGGVYVVWPSRQFVPARVELFREYLIAELTAQIATRCRSGSAA